MDYKTLNNGEKMPVLGFGTHGITGSSGVEIVKNAINLGYRLIDTAFEYGNEEVIGEAIRQSNVPRSELFISSKLETQDTNGARAEKAFYGTLERLGLDYLDLYIIHHPYNDVFAAWRVLEKLVREGKIKSIGVSNFAPDQLVNLAIFNEIKPAVNQIEVNPFNQQDEAISYHEQYGITTESWSPFARGRHNLFDSKEVNQIAEKYGKTVSQIILRWHIERDVIPIPKATSALHQKENLDVFDFKLDSHDKKIIASLNLDEEFMNHESPEIVERMAHRIIR
jgi:2,5-diketo-D-gluconate reductase A